MFVGNVRHDARKGFSAVLSQYDALGGEVGGGDTCLHAGSCEAVVGNLEFCRGKRDQGGPNEECGVWKCHDAPGTMEST